MKRVHLLTLEIKRNNHSRTCQGEGGKLPPKSQKLGQNQNFFDTDKEIFGQNQNFLGSDEKNLDKIRHFSAATRNRMGKI